MIQKKNLYLYNQNINKLKQNQIDIYQNYKQIMKEIKLNLKIVYKI